MGIQLLQSMLAVMMSLEGSSNAVEVDFSGSGNLVVEVSGFAGSQGHAIALAYEDSETFLKQPVDQGKVKIKNGKASFLFQELFFGPHAILVFHDSNDNGTFDRSELGIPLEAYGFSNQARDDYGWPSFAEAVFIFLKDTEPVKIQVQ